ncbi:MAG TPA: NHL repeat-containing protein, partial [Solirubrobacteraceae bacterium]|nr:NHL repeat-containing protein [Solirubrobacteraceae bacterium]
MTLPLRRCPWLLLTLAVIACSLLVGVSAVRAAGYDPVGSFTAGLNEPVGVAVDNSSGPSGGDVYVASEVEATGVSKFDAEGSSLSPPSPFDTEAFELETAADGPARLSGAAVDPLNGDVYIVNARGEQIQMFTPAGQEVDNSVFPISVAGSKVPVFLGKADGLVVQIATDSAGDIYFPNPANDAVQEFSPATGDIINTFEGTSVGAFNKPAAVAVDSEGNVYVADTGAGRVVRIAGEAGQPNPAGAQTVLAEGGARTVAIDPSNGDVFVGKYNE